MPKSKYPQQLDTSIELPLVRDNITEIGSDVINSLRSAIFQIEKTLGINPQGAVGNSLAGRLDKALDETGNIKSEALALANVLTGPILDVDVSKVAAIQESKLKLDYPTSLLQAEVSALNDILTDILTELAEVSATLSAHINPSALDRHPAISISVDAATSVPNDTATTSPTATDLQNTIESFYDAHINYSGANISSTNRSHTADQIFLDNTNNPDVILSKNVQGAIDDLASIESTGFKSALLNLHSNGRIRAGKITDDFDGSSLGAILLDNVSATYLQDAGASRAIFTLSTPILPDESLSKFDFLTLSGSVHEEDNRTYQIIDFTVDVNDKVETITVLSAPLFSSASGLLITVAKNPYVAYNLAGLATTVRPRSNRSNTPDVQVSNPDCATIISSSINPTQIDSSTHQFNISIDGGSEITLDTFDSSVSTQTLDSIVNKINEQAVDQHLNFLAYKVKIESNYELALVHNVPNLTGDVVQRSLKITAPASNDGLEILGLQTIEDLTFIGTSGNSVFVNGSVLKDFGLVQEFSGETIQVSLGTANLTSLSPNFSELGVRVGDLIVITNAGDTSEDGSYRIKTVSSDTLELDLDSFTFGTQVIASTQFYILRNSALIDEMVFEEISSSDGSIIFDVFVSDEKDVNYSKRLEVDGVLQDASFSAAVSDLSTGFLLSDETATLTIDTDGFATLTTEDLATGAAVFVGSTGRYEIATADELFFVVLQVKASAAPGVIQTVDLIGFNEVSRNNYLVCRGNYSTALGRVLGEGSDSGIPVLLDKRRTGTANAEIVGDTFIEKYIEGPRNELRAGGIIRDCEVSTAQILISGGDFFQTFSVSAGILVVNGIRYEFPGFENIKVDGDDTFYVAIDAFGSLKTGTAITDPTTSLLISPFAHQSVVHLAEISNDGSTCDIVDLRFFIDHLDYKLLTEITVSPDKSFGHFTDLLSAVEYSKRFTKMFPNLSNVSIFVKEGEYEIADQITLDFDLTIRGSGKNTVLTKSGSLATGVASDGDKVSLATALFLIGQDSLLNSDDIIHGITLRDFVYTTSADLDFVGCVIGISQGLATSQNLTLVFDNLSFIGPETMDGSVADPTKVGEYAFVIGKQFAGTLVPLVGADLGNILITNCRFRRIGLEHGGVKFLESSGGTFENIIVQGNIATEMSPNVNDTAFTILEYPTSPTLTEVIEIGNVSRTT